LEQGEEIDIPLTHTAVRENNKFMDRLALMRVEKRWSEQDLTDFLETKGYRPETIRRFCRGVELRLSDSKSKPKKPKRSEGAMTREEVAKIEDPEARRLAEKYLKETRAP
jgi:hypothetical protein